MTTTSAPSGGGVVDPNTGQPVATAAPAPMPTAPAASTAPATTTVVDPTTGQPIATVTVAPIAAPAATAAQPGAVAPAGTTPVAGTPVAGQPGAVAGQPTAVGAAAGAAAPASTLPTWNNWVAVFTQLGLGQADVQAIGAQNLSDQQLALVYTKIKDELAASGTNPGNGTTGPNGTDPNAQGQQPGQSAWSPEWEKKFLAAGLSATQVAEIKKQAEQVGATDQQLSDLLAKAGSLPGWSDDYQKQFAALGMPQNVIDQYKNSGAPKSGLDAALKNATERVDAFKKDGYYDKFKKEGIKDDEIWGIILADKQPTHAELDKYLNQQHVASQPKWKKFGQMALSFVPGVDLAQYAIGKKFLTGEDIDRKNPMNIAFAALSGITAFTALRGVANIARGVKALDGGLLAVKAAGLPLEGGAAVADAAGGAAHTMSFGQKLSAFLPFTKAHGEAQFASQMTSAANYFTSAGEARLLDAGTEIGKTQAQGLRQMFTDIGSGAVTGSGGKMAYWGSVKRMIPFKGASEPMTLVGDNMIKVTKSINASGKNGDVILGNLLKITGDKIAMNPEWVKMVGADGKLATALSPEALKDISKLEGANVKGFGEILASDGARTLGLMERGNIGGKVLPGSLEWLQHLAKSTGENPAWFTKILTTAGGKAATAAGTTVAGSLVMAKVGEGMAAAHSAGSAASDAATVARDANGNQLAIEAGPAGKAAGAAGTAPVAGGGSGVSESTIDSVAGAAGVQPTGAASKSWERAYNNGTRQYHGTDGSVTTAFADGRVKEVAADGRITLTSAEGTVRRYKDAAAMNASKLSQPTAEAAAPHKLPVYGDMPWRNQKADPSKLTDAQKDAVFATTGHLEGLRPAGQQATGPGGAVLLG